MTKELIAQLRTMLAQPSAIQLLFDAAAELERLYKEASALRDENTNLKRELAVLHEQN